MDPPIVSLCTALYLSVWWWANIWAEMTSLCCSTSARYLQTVQTQSHLQPRQRRHHRYLALKCSLQCPGVSGLGLPALHTSPQPVEAPVSAVCVAALVLAAELVEPLELAGRDVAHDPGGAARHRQLGQELLQPAEGGRWSVTADM